MENHNPLLGSVEGELCPLLNSIFSPSMEHCSNPGDPCITIQGCMDEVKAEDSTMYEIPLQKKEDRLPFQIFPDPVEVVLSPEGMLGCILQGKERLPSIVVEPTDVSEVESGELRWPPEHGDSDEDEDLFLEQCIPPANIADWGEEDEEEAESSIIVNNQMSTSILDLLSDNFRDDTPTPTAENPPVLN